ncbi:GAF domain-containing protein [Solicola sp. PLA-1-18]|uniref:GAF domain-containing protein n=1 Tax=Solicola sp. PLA-1-18 TaxID=3380532 RepID=UPI003B75EEA3
MQPASAPRRGTDAVRPGTDLALRARELVLAHEAVLSGGTPPAPVRPVVRRSWSRVMGWGVDPDGGGDRDPLPWTQVEERRRASMLGSVVEEVRQSVAAVADVSSFLLVVTDAAGIVLWRDGSSRVRRQADALGFSEGADWTESRVGTNAIGTALAEAAPVQLFSAEHFEQSQHPWYCTAVPVHDPVTGDLLGVVDVSGPAMTLHPAITALVSTAVRLAESTLWRRHTERLGRLRESAAPLLVGSPGPSLVVDDLGWVAHASGIATRDRVGAPVAGQPIAVPGMGLCLPEPIDHGWLLRPHGGTGRLHLLLDLTGEPTVTVSGPSERWHAALSTRHAEILRLLAASPEGLTAQALSTALYGDADHAVTVRAEVSRMRRTLGGVLAAQPYRFADGVSVEVASGTGSGRPSR